MAKIVISLPTTPDRVFSLLEDPRSLAYFVVGTRTIRRFDPGWPDPQTEVHHTIGIFPFLLRDKTTVVEAQPGTYLALEARFRPIGVMRVEFRLADRGDHTELTVDEYPVSGPVAVSGIRRAVDALVALRNLEMSRRLKRLIDAREAQLLLARHYG
jgi:Polyketide cyclase / dehydrase and lipid transport